MMNAPKTEKVICNRCGGLRNHQVVGEHVESFEAAGGDITVWKNYQIVKCMGCEIVRFRQSETCSEAIDEETGQLEEYEIQVFPELPQPRRRAVDHNHFPDDVAKMYAETILAFNAGANTLTGGGLRATVEAICKDQKVAGGNLKDRIDNLVSKGVLAKAQADFLHEERYIGNDALHEMKTPTDQDIEDGLKIVEGMLNTIYVLPSHAARLKGKRAATTTATPPSPPTKKKKK